MTLITNYIGKDYIIIAGDKRVTRVDEVKKMNILEDRAVKIFTGGKYCIGIQGDVKTEKSNYHNRLALFIKKSHDLIPPELINMLLNEFSDVHEDKEVYELNLIISGTNGNELFSYFIDAKNQAVLNCGDVDQMGIRFNNSNSFDEIKYRQAIIFLEQYMGENGISDGRQIKSLRDFSQGDLINGLKSVYDRFGKNDFNYPSIGPVMDYCIIYKDGTIENNIDLNR